MKIYTEQDYKDLSHRNRNVLWNALCREVAEIAETTLRAKIQAQDLQRTALLVCPRGYAARWRSGVRAISGDPVTPWAFIDLQNEAIWLRKEAKKELSRQAVDASVAAFIDEVLA